MQIDTRQIVIQKDINIDRKVNSQKDRQVFRQIKMLDKFVDSQMNNKIDSYKDRKVDSYKDRKINRQLYRYICRYIFGCLNFK